MTAYILADNKIVNAEAYASYITAITASVEKFGGRYLVRGGQPVRRSGNRQWNRVVLIEFPSMEAAEAWLDDPNLASLHAMRETNAETQLVLLPGLMPEVVVRSHEKL